MSGGRRWRRALSLNDRHGLYDLDATGWMHKPALHGRGPVQISTNRDRLGWARHCEWQITAFASSPIKANGGWQSYVYVFND